MPSSYATKRCRHCGNFFHGRSGDFYCGARCKIKWWSEPNEAGCWIWGGTITKHGYGQTRDERGVVCRAHRLAYAAFVGDPGDKHVCHACDVRRCVNPEHLFLGSAKENFADMVRKGRQVKGERASQSKLTAASVRQIRTDSRSIRALARSYGVSTRTIVLIRKRETWKHVE